MSTHYYGHGRVFISARDSSGNPSNFIELEDVDAMDISLTVDYIEHINKSTAIAQKDLKVARMLSGTGKITMSSHDAATLAKNLYANVETVSGGSFSATTLDKTTVVVGDILPLPGGKTQVSSLVMTDSTGSPVTLTLDTHYSIVDADAGLIKILSLSTLTQPLKAAGTEAAGKALGLLTTRTPDQYLRFAGINIANDDAPCVVDLYRISIDPAANWTLLNDGNTPNQYEINFEMLRDPEQAYDATYGQFGKYKE